MAGKRKARSSRNESLLRDMAHSAGLEPKAVCETVEAVFSTIPNAILPTGIQGELDAIGKNRADLARACCPLTASTISDWLNGKTPMGLTELCICILGLCMLSGRDCVASCAGSVAALCAVDVLGGGENAIRKAIISDIMETIETRLEATDTPTLQAVAVFVRRRYGLPD